MPQVTRTDRMGALGTSQGRRFSLHPPTVEFAVHHGTEIKACQAGDAKRKGKIERPFRGLEASFLEELAVLGPPSSIAELNELRQGLAGRAGEQPGALDHRGGPRRAPGHRAPVLGALPPRRFDTAYRRAPPGPRGRAAHRVGRGALLGPTRVPRPEGRGPGRGGLRPARDHLGWMDVATHRLVDSPHDDVWDPAHRQAAEAAALGRTRVPLRVVGAVPASPARPHRSADYDVDAPDLDCPLRSRRGRCHDHDLPYEQLKDDLGYLQLGRAAECFATLADRGQDARAGATSSTWPRSWPNRRPPPPTGAWRPGCAIARFPYRRTLEDFDFDFQPSRRQEARRRSGHPALHRGEPPRRVPRPARVRQDPPGRGPRHQGGRGRLPGLLHHRRRHGPAPPPGPTGGDLRHQARGFTAPSCWSSTTSGLLPIDTEGAGVFFHVVNARYENGHPTLVTTNRGLPAWGDVFGDPVVAGAILDRLMHNAVVFNIKGPSWRMREHPALAEASKA